MTVFSVHIPKTGGTSFLHLLSQKYRDGLVLDYGMDRDAVLRRIVDGSAQCVHGHYVVQKYAGCEGTFVTWLRHPLDRLVSHYNFWKTSRYPDQAHWRRFHYENWDFMQFALSAPMQSEQHKYAGGIDFDHYAVIGMTEFFDESMELFKRALELHFDEIPHMREADANRSAFDPRTLSKQEIARLTEFHRADFEIYAKGLARFRELTLKSSAPLFKTGDKSGWGPVELPCAEGFAAMAGREIVGERIKQSGVGCICGTYYYGDAWPINAWDSFRRDVVDSYLSLIKKNDYNTVILLVPASLSLIRRQRPIYFNWFMADFKLLVEKIRAAGLNYCLRLAYAWDGYPVEGNRGRQCFAVLSGGREREDFKALLGELWSMLANDPKFLFGFITWEDMLMFPIHGAPNAQRPLREVLAKEIGYEGFAEGVPNLKDPDSERYLHFLDSKFSELFYDLKTVFPALTAEVRVDITPHTGRDGKIKHFQHIRQMIELDSDVIGTYFGTYMIRQKNQPTAEQGMEALSLAHAAVRSVAPGKKLFVDQLNFVIVEKAFSHFPKMSAAEETRFMEMLVAWFDDTTVGYATWSFIDYLTDIVANSAFRLGLDGWIIEGGEAKLVVEGDSRYLPLKVGQSIRGTNIKHYSAWVSGGWLHIEADPSEDVLLYVELSEDTSFELTAADFETWPLGVGHHLLRHFIGKSVYLKLSVRQGEVKLRRLTLGQEICSNGGCSLNMEATDSSERIANFNRALAKSRAGGNHDNLMTDEAIMSEPEKYPVPPEDLRWRVVGNRDENYFLQSSKRAMGFFDSVLAKGGKSFKDFSEILDFGCGCGRLIRSLRGLSTPAARLYGSDIDAEAIAWCAQNIPDARFSVNGEYPPLPFGDASIDLVYASSVFTHLDAEHQFRWLEELRRIVKPGGYLLLTFRHKYNIDQIRDEAIRNRVREEVARHGIYYMTTALWKGVFPSWYGGAYHTPEYIKENWGKYFELLHIADAGVVTQNTALFRR